MGGHVDYLSKVRAAGGDIGWFARGGGRWDVLQEIDDEGEAVGAGGAGNEDFLV